MMENKDNILLFKTNILTATDKDLIQPMLDRHPDIARWSVDLDDDDRVLRIISSTLTCTHVMDMIKLHGYACEELKDQ
jgi:hypothetical protein